MWISTFFTISMAMHMTVRDVHLTQSINGIMLRLSNKSVSSGRRVFLFAARRQCAAWRTLHCHRLAISASKSHYILLTSWSLRLKKPLEDQCCNKKVVQRLLRRFLMQLCQWYSFVIQPSHKGSGLIPGLFSWSTVLVLHLQSTVNAPKTPVCLHNWDTPVHWL